MAVSSTRSVYAAVGFRSSNNPHKRLLDSVLLRWFLTSRLWLSLPEYRLRYQWPLSLHELNQFARASNINTYSEECLYQFLSPRHLPTLTAAPIFRDANNGFATALCDTAVPDSRNPSNVPCLHHSSEHLAQDTDRWIALIRFIDIKFSKFDGLV